MARALSLFYPLILPHVVGAPDPLLDQAILDTVGTFCRETSVVQETAVQSIVALQQDYDVDIPSGTQLVKVLAVWHADTRLRGVGTDEVDSGVAMRGSFGSYTLSSGTPTAFFMKTPVDPIISLYPVPDTALTDGLAIRSCFEPSSSATTVPDAVYDFYSSDIAAGVISYLMMLPNQAFSNPLLAKKYDATFSAAMGKARSVARYGQARRSMSVRPRNFA